SRANKTPVELLRGKAPNLPPASSFYPHALSPPTWGNSCLNLPLPLYQAWREGAGGLLKTPVD
ncbi:MAG: hypothetical protein LBD01_05925, partial [Puniceicoccales bacterium]|nr:hypothetical protein [Puniceicoccales bacterium]